MSNRNFKTKYGYFSEDGREYIITSPNTPKPWVNVISNGNYGLVVSQMNGGFSWMTHSNLNRLTRWQQDLIQDNWGKYLILKNESNGEIWSPAVQPIGKQPDFYECRHGIGYTEFKSVYKNIECSLRIFVPFGDDLEIWTVTLKNRGREKRRISVYSYFEWALGAAPDNHREFHKTFIETGFESSLNAITANKRLWEVAAPRGHWNTNWPYLAYFATDRDANSYETDKFAFIGQNRSLQNALAFEKDQLDNGKGKWGDAAAALLHKFALAPEQVIQYNYFLGAVSDSEELKLKLDIYQNNDNVDAAFSEMQNFWRELLDKSTVDTPDIGLNILTNHWLKYQAISCRLWGRAAYYQQSGAYGFRDQLQDSLIFLPINPDLTKKQIRLHAGHQFANGRVLHWWHPITEQGLDAGMTDDLLWLPFLTVQYLKETGDWNFLREKLKYYDGYSTVPLLEHCTRAIDLVLERMSERGLPLILSGDWNDGLSAVGLEGKGESVWLAEFLYLVLNEMQIPLRKQGETAKAEQYLKSAEKLKIAVNTIAWDGDWFWRASKDNGELLGSKTNAEGKIFLNSQTWAIISGIADPERQKKVMEQVVKYLESKVGTLLFQPAYSKPDEEIGYLSRYAPGVRENGGVYTHAATWSVWAAGILGDRTLAYRLFNKISPIRNGANPDEYFAEPYVSPGNIDGPDSPNYGRGGWSWYTGSAAWMQRVVFDYLVGVRATYDGLEIKPCFPPEWDTVRVKRHFRGTDYLICFTTNKNLPAGEMQIYCDGELIAGNILPLDPAKLKINIEVKTGH